MEDRNRALCVQAGYVEEGVRAFIERRKSASPSARKRIDGERWRRLQKRAAGNSGGPFACFNVERAPLDAVA
jgi:hypothetical protein